MKMKVIRNAVGEIINVGDWDYQREPVFANDLSKPIFQGDEIVAYEQKQLPDRVQNPLPEGAYEDVADIIEAEDGGRHPAENYRQLRATEYPAIGDQLDALFRAGVFPEDMAVQLAAVKAKYPKTTG